MRPADITKDVLEFCKSFYAGTWSTERFAKEVDKSGLLKGIEDNGDGLRYIDKVPVMGLSADQWESLDDEQLMSKLKRAPAGIKTHHAYEGGLLRHVVDLLRMAGAIAPLYPQLDPDMLLVGVFFTTSVKSMN